MNIRTGDGLLVFGHFLCGRSDGGRVGVLAFFVLALFLFPAVATFQSDDSLERELFFPLRNHTLSFPCKLPEDHDTAAKASVLLDQIINANSDRIAANQKSGYQNQLGTRILLQVDCLIHIVSELGILVELLVTCYDYPPQDTE